MDDVYSVSDGTISNSNITTTTSISSDRLVVSPQPQYYVGTSTMPVSPEMEYQRAHAFYIQNSWPSVYQQMDQMERYGTPRTKSRNLKQYTNPDFSKVKDILPKHLELGAAMLPKEDVKSRIAEYLK